METTWKNPNTLNRRFRGRLAAGLAAIAFTAACSSSETLEPTAEPGSSFSDAADEATERIECYSRFEPFEDCDEDGIANAADVIPGRDDLADDDGDTVINKFDRYPQSDDRTFDMDSDGLADYADTFYGNNNEDIDADGLINGFDPQPYAAPPSGVAVTPPSGIAPQQLTESLLLRQMTGKFSAELVGAKPDADFDGIPDDIDTTRTKFTNDRDGDGDADYYDPEPGDYSIDSRNDPYDPGNDEYWED